MEIHLNPTVTFLVKLRQIDKSECTVRDILVLYTIINNPGIMGVDVANKLGLKNRSAIQSSVARLIREGMIEDRRERALKANPSILHALQHGIDLWNEIKP